MLLGILYIPSLCFIQNINKILLGLASNDPVNTSWWISFPILFRNFLHKFDSTDNSSSFTESRSCTLDRLSNYKAVASSIQLLYFFCSIASLQKSCTPILRNILCRMEQPLLHYLALRQRI